MVSSQSMTSSVTNRPTNVATSRPRAVTVELTTVRRVSRSTISREVRSPAVCRRRKAASRVSRWVNKVLRATATMPRPARIMAARWT